MTQASSAFMKRAPSSASIAEAGMDLRMVPFNGLGMWGSQPRKKWPPTQLLAPWASRSEALLQTFDIMLDLVHWIVAFRWIVQ